MTEAIRINRSEELALRYVDHLARCLYMALRWSMNFKTGVVGGEEKAISWQSLREDTEVPGRPGFKGIRPSEQQLRRRARQLEKYGLLRDIGTQLRLRFECLLADTDNRGSKKADTGSIGARPTREPKRDKAERRYAQGDSVRKADTHQDSGNFSTHPNPSHASGAEGVNDQPPTPAAREGDLDPQRTHIDSCELSEQRHESAGSVGEKLHPDEGREGAIPWERHLAWPVRIPPAQRAYVARMLATVPSDLRQVVLDEWQGVCETTHVNHQWKLFSYLVREIRNGTREPRHADRIRLRRDEARAARAAAKATALALAEAESRRAAPPEGWLDRMKGVLGARWRGDANC